MAAILCRRLISNMDDFTTKIGIDVQDVCKNQLVQAAQMEQDQQMRKKLCECIAELAKCYLGKFL